jgi:hypothetical protein
MEAIQERFNSSGRRKMRTAYSILGPLLEHGWIT